jgi:hypothetical protein
MQPATIEHIKPLVTVGGAIRSFVVFSIGVSTYLRTEKWKRAIISRQRNEGVLCNSASPKGLVSDRDLKVSFGFTTLLVRAFGLRRPHTFLSSKIKSSRLNSPEQ